MCLRVTRAVPVFVLGSNVSSDIVGFIGDLLIDIDVTAFRRKPRREL